MQLPTIWYRLFVFMIKDGEVGPIRELKKESVVISCCYNVSLITV